MQARSLIKRSGRVLFLSMCLSTCFAQPRLVEVISPQVDLGKDICVVVDMSGSMRHWASTCLEAAQELTQNPSDGWDLAVLAFANSFSKYPSQGMIKMPDLEARNEALAWLDRLVNVPYSNLLSLGSDTFVLSALTKALELGDVILITDGHFNEQISVVLSLIAAYSARKVAVIGVGNLNVENLTLIGKLGGGYWELGGDQ